jgi:hypothetical protein
MTHASMIRNSLVYQTDPRMPRNFQLYGCRARCLLAIPEFIAGRALTPEQIIDITDRGMKIDGVLVNEFYRSGKNEHWLINEAFLSLGLRRTGRQVGWNDSHIHDRQWEYMIQHLATGTNTGHFVLADRNQQMIFDPWKEDQAGYSLNAGDIIRRLVYRTWEV